MVLFHQDILPLTSLYMSPSTHPPYGRSDQAVFPSQQETLKDYEGIIAYRKTAIDMLHDADSIDLYCAEHITPMRTPDYDTQIVRHMLRDYCDMRVITLMLEQDPDCQVSEKWRRAVGRSQSILRFIDEYPKEFTQVHRRELLEAIVKALQHIVNILSQADRMCYLCSNDHLVLGEARRAYGQAFSELQRMTGSVEV